MISTTMTRITTLLPLVLPMSPPEHDESTENYVLDLCTKEHHHTPKPYINPKRIDTPPCAMSPQSEFSDTSEVSSTDINSNSISKIKHLRPFKAYPKDLISMTFTGSALDVLEKESLESYMKFRERMLSQVQHNQNTNKNMRREQSNKNIADPDYLEKRKKNNEAAKKSRDARKAKEDEMAIRLAFLEQEIVRLECRLELAEAERKRLQDMAYH